MLIPSALLGMPIECAEHGPDVQTVQSSDNSIRMRFIEKFALLRNAATMKQLPSAIVGSASDTRALALSHPSHIQAVQDVAPVFGGQPISAPVEMWPLQLLEFVNNQIDVDHGEISCHVAPSPSCASTVGQSCHDEKGTPVLHRPPPVVVNLQASGHHSSYHGHAVQETARLSHSPERNVSCHRRSNVTRLEGGTMLSPQPGSSLHQEGQIKLAAPVNTLAPSPNAEKPRKETGRSASHRSSL